MMIMVLMETGKVWKRTTLFKRKMVNSLLILHIKKPINMHSRFFDKLLAEPSKVYTVEIYYRKNKSFPGLRHMVVKVKNVDKMCYEYFYCVVYSYHKSSANRDLRDSSDGSAFTLYLACISFISIMVAKFKQAILHFECGLAKTYQTY